MSRKSIIKSLDRPVRSTAIWPTLRFVLQEHGTEQPYWSLRIETNGTLYTWHLHQAPSTNPLRVVSASFQGLADSKRLLIDADVPANQPEQEILTEEFGWVMPVETAGQSQAEAFHHQFMEGRIELRIEGSRLKGGFVLEGRGDRWRIRKTADEFASIVEPEWTE